MDEKAFRRMSRQMPDVRWRLAAAVEARLQRDREFGLERD